MNRLELAISRFSAALESLEKSVDSRLEDQRKAESYRAELEFLKGERDRLFARIAALEDESRNLAGLTEEVEYRLDGAIAEIREALSRH